MDSTLDVRFRAQDDTLFHRSLDLRLTSQLTLRTPTRAIDARLVRRSPLLVREPLFYEYYIRPSGSKLDRIIHEKEEELARSYELKGIRKVAGDNPLLLLQEFYETRYPDDPQLQFLIRTAHAYSDLLVLPLVSRVTDGMDAGVGFEKYLDFLGNVLATVETYNKKPVMGVVPLKTPFIRIEELVDFYVGHGIRALCLDYASSMPDTARQSVEQVGFSLAREGVLEETFIYGINVSSGRPRATTPISPCHSILSYGFGCDGFGDLHRVRMKISEGQPPGPTLIRLFSRRDYGEYLVRDRDDLQALTPEETRVDLGRCVDDKGLAKLFNAEQHSLEALHVRPLFEGARDSPGMEPYLRQKEHVDKTQLKWMRALVGALRQRRLSDL
ncbi:MAG: hypothetical protein ACE5IJ_11850 [Thermoplasmata archaeon]